VSGKVYLVSVNFLSETRADIQGMAFSYVIFLVPFTQNLIEKILTIFQDIYFLQNNTSQHTEALALRDAVLRLRRDGAFIAVPLWRVNEGPIGPHPAGVYILSSLYSSIGNDG